MTSSVVVIQQAIPFMNLLIHEAALSILLQMYLDLSEGRKFKSALLVSQG